MKAKLNAIHSSLEEIWMIHVHIHIKLLWDKDTAGMRTFPESIVGVHKAEWAHLYSHGESLTSNPLDPV